MAELDKVIKTGLLEVHERAKRDAVSYITGQKVLDKFFWRGYRFLLEGHELFYYNSTGGEQVGKIKMAYGVKARVHDMSDRVFSFCIDRGIKGRMILSAYSEEERDIWIAAINTVCEHNDESFETLRQSFTQRSSRDKDEPITQKESQNGGAEKHGISVPSSPSNTYREGEGPLGVASDEERHLLWHVVHILTALMVVSVRVWRSYGSIPSYMDEVFHIPQAQRVVQSSIYEGLLAPGAWDPKITTFPGTYLFSTGLHLGSAWMAKMCRSSLRILAHYLPLSWQSSLPGHLFDGARGEGASSWGWMASTGSTATQSTTSLFASWIDWGGTAASSAQSLRFGNVLLGNLTFLVAVLARKAILRSDAKNVHEKGTGLESSVVTVMLALAIALFPVLFFHHFLYYTDSTSTFCLVLVTWIANIAANPQSTTSFSDTILVRVAMLGGVLFSATAAVLARQTNAVWLIFIAGTVLEPGSRAPSPRLADCSSVSTIIDYVHYVLWPPLGYSLAHVTAAALLMPVTAFIYFVVQLNDGSVVLGDKVNHTPVVHLAMPLHALAITSACLCLSSSDTMNATNSSSSSSSSSDVAAAPAHVPYTSKQGPTPNPEERDDEDDEDDIHGTWRRRASVVTAVNAERTSQSTSAVADTARHSTAGAAFLHLCGAAAITAALYYSSLAHPFLLSDNRHYTFYVWKRLLSRSEVRLLLGPLYYALIYSGLRKLWNSQGIVWMLGYIAAVAITLTPTPLLEPRYFVPAVLFGLLGSGRSGGDHASNAIAVGRLGLLVTMFVVMNIATIYIFLFCPFADGSQRFMY